MPALDRLAQLEIGWHAIAMASGVSVSTLRRVHEGRADRVRRETANRILRFAAQNFDREVPGWSTTERLRALAALGHTEAALQARFGPPRSTVTYRRMLQVLNAVLTASPGSDDTAVTRAQLAGWSTPDQIGPIIFDPEWDGSHVRRSV